ncbi:MAG: hypothetical protein Q7S84_00460 [bacterium]|nr:hypothetical protein [bacterium]
MDAVAIASGMFVVMFGIGWLLRRSVKMMKGGLGYTFDAEKQTSRKFRWGGR